MARFALAMPLELTWIKAPAPKSVLMQDMVNPRARPGMRRTVAALVELAPDIVALIDRDRIIKYVSPAVEPILGYTPGELVGKRFDELLHPKDFATADKAFTAMVGTHNTVTAQDRFRRKDGSWITLETVGRNYLAVPELEGVLVCSRDVTRHVELESTLRKSTDEALQFFENAPCGYHSVDAEGIYRRVNATELRWLQRSRDELVGKLRFADLLSPASRPAYWDGFAMLKEAKAVGNLEVEIARRDGTTFPGLLQSVAVVDGKGRFVESRTTVYDITERKRAERALMKVNRALSVLSEARREIIVARGESALLNAVCRVLVERDVYRLAAVHYVLHDARSTMKVVAKAGVGDQYLEDAAITWNDTALGQGPVGTAVRTGQAQVNRNYLTDPRMAPWRELAVSAGFRSSMSVPVKDEAGVFATLSVFATEPDAFDTEEVRVLEELADDLSFAIGSLLAEKFAREHAALKRMEAETGEPDPVARLSPREREVLKLVAEGHSSREIAALLGVAPASVGTYRSRLMFKLNVEDVTGLVRFAIRHGVIKA
jgi:PAS domain S-box-containing protein